MAGPGRAGAVFSQQPDYPAGVLPVMVGLAGGTKRPHRRLQPIAAVESLPPGKDGGVKKILALVWPYPLSIHARRREVARLLQAARQENGAPRPTSILMYQNIGEILILFWRTLRSMPSLWRERQKIFDQLFEIGNASLFMVCVLSLFIGGVLALQTGPVLVERGISSVLGGMIGLSMCKELAPVMIAILIAGRIGSSMSAEIGSMRVYEEIDALRTMNIDPVRYLVLPRMVAIAVALPTLVLFSIPVG